MPFKIEKTLLEYGVSFDLCEYEDSCIEIEYNELCLYIEQKDSKEILSEDKDIIFSVKDRRCYINDKNIGKKYMSDKIKTLFGLLFMLNNLNNKLPRILIEIRDYLIKCNLDIISNQDDGRTNSMLDEDYIIKILEESPFNSKIKRMPIRWWYDIKVYNEDRDEWIPVNIKSTTMTTADNIGNFAVCVQAYTNVVLDLDKCYSNGEMSRVLFECLKSDNINKDINKDYYFLVINKCNTSDIIINSILGLNNITFNINNIPFQVKWNNNKKYLIYTIYEKVEMFKKLFKKNCYSWREEFISNMRSL